MAACSLAFAGHLYLRYMSRCETWTILTPSAYTATPLFRTETTSAWVDAPATSRKNRSAASRSCCPPSQLVPPSIFQLMPDIERTPRFDIYRVRTPPREEFGGAEFHLHFLPVLMASILSRGVLRRARGARAFSAAPLSAFETLVEEGSRLVRLTAASEATGCDIFGKAEYELPGGSVKDRAALWMLRGAEARGELVRGEPGQVHCPLPLKHIGEPGAMC